MHPPTRLPRFLAWSRNLGCTLALLTAGSVPGLAQDQPPAEPRVPAATTAQWRTHPRLFPGIANVNGRVYILGGHTQVGAWRPQAGAEVLDPATGNVTSLPDMPVARAVFGCAAIGDKIYVIGGATYPRDDGSVMEYDTGSGRWTAKAPLTQPRQGLRAAAVGTKIYAFGGFQEHYRDFEVYDAVTGVWTRLPDMPHGALNPAWLVHEGKILVAGGGTPDGKKAVDAFQSYDPATGRWSDLPALPVPKGDHAIGIVGGHLYVVGGWNDVPLSSVEAFDLATRSWTTVAGLPGVRFYHGGIAITGRILLIGGVNADTRSAGSYLLSIDAYAPPFPAGLPPQ